jgi:hypothetical protein
MKELIKQYEASKKRALNFMKKGQLNAYFKSLVEMNETKKLILLTSSN